MIKAFYGNGAVNYLNAEKCQLLSAKNSEEYNVEKGYYWDENEKTLNEGAEKNFSCLSREIKKLVKSKSRDYSKTRIDQNTIYRFFAYQILRDPANSLNILKRISGENDIKLLKEHLRDFQNWAIRKENEEQLYTKRLMKDFDIVLEPNYTKTEYIAVNAPVTIKFREGEMYVLVANPKLAFCLVEKEMFNRLNLGLVRNDGLDCVRQTNECIMAHAIKHEPHEVLGTNQEYLISLCRETKSKIID